MRCVDTCITCGQSLLSSHSLSPAVREAAGHNTVEGERGEGVAINLETDNATRPSDCRFCFFFIIVILMGIKPKTKYPQKKISAGSLGNSGTTLQLYL